MSAPVEPAVSVSVTEVRNALRCPRIFALGRMGARAVAFPIGSSCLGSAFHRIVERFAAGVDAPPPGIATLGEGAPLDAIVAGLRACLLDLLAAELEGDAALRTMPGEVDDLAEALRQLATHLAARRRRVEGTPASALARLVRAGDRAIEAEAEPGVLVRGRHDALYADPDGALDVIEYKLTDEENDAVDRAQVALYSHMMRVATGARARPVVLRFMPMLRETTISHAEADVLVERTVRPVLRRMAAWSADPRSAPATERADLCAACPMVVPCSATYPERVGPRDDPPSGAARPRPGPEGETTVGPPRVVEPAAGDEEGKAEGERLRDLILAELRAQGIHAACPRPPLVGPTLVEIEVTRSRGPIAQLDRAAADVCHRLDAQGVEVELEKRRAKRVFVTRRATPRRVTLDPLLDEMRAYLAERPGRFVLGQRPSGEILVGDLGDASTPHLLVGGRAGSGKSCLLRAIVASLMHYHPPSAIRFVLVDPKRVTFHARSFQAAVSAHLDGPIRYEMEETLPVLERLVEAMEERYRLFEDARVSDILEYNEGCDPARRLERRVVVIDEFQDLTSDKATRQAFVDVVKRLGAKARAAGVHLVVATQRPDRETVPPILKTNLGGKIALKVTSAVNSRIILDEPGAEKLLGRGDLLADLGAGLVRAQAPLV